MNFRALQADAYSNIADFQGVKRDGLPNRIICGDALNVMGQMPAGSVDPLIPRIPIA